MAGQAGAGHQAEQEGQPCGGSEQQPLAQQLAQPQHRSQSHQHPQGGDDGCTRERQQGAVPPPRLGRPALPPASRAAASGPADPARAGHSGAPAAPGPPAAAGRGAAAPAAPCHRPRAPGRWAPGGPGGPSCEGPLQEPQAHHGHPGAR
jgi:hypothetical protein